MKVLYVSHTGLVSGAERALLDLLEVLPATVRPTVACPRGPLADAVGRLGIEVAELPGISGGFRLHPTQTPATLIELAAAARALAAVVRSTGPDLVHANTVRAGLVTSLARTPRRAALVVHNHDQLGATRTTTAVRAALRPAPDAIIAISAFAARGFAEERFEGRVRILYNPLDTRRFDPATQSRTAARDALGLPPDTPLIGLVAQITPWKGHELAIRIVARLQRQFPELRLLIVGEAKFTSRATSFDNIAYLDSLHRLVAELGVEDRVEFWGERDDVETIFRALDVALTPSWAEPFGRSVIEAMAVGTPVVATSVGGPPEFIDDGVDGFLVSPDDELRWAEVVTGLLDGSVPSEEIGRRASEKVRERFNRDAYAARVVDVYDEVIRARAERPSSGRRNRTAAAAKHPQPREPGRGLRVLFVDHSQIKGGGQHSLLELMDSLRSTHDVQLACPAGPLTDAARAGGFTVHEIPDSQLSFRLNARSLAREATRVLAARRALGRHIDRVGPDIVHANSLRAGLLGAGLSRGRMVVHCRDLLPPGLAAEAVRRLVLASSEEVVAVSRTAAARLAGPRWAQRHVTVIDNPVDTERFDPERLPIEAARRALELTGTPVLGLVAQITPWKGHTRAVRILAGLREEHPGAELVIAGEAKFVTPSTRFDNQAYERELRDLVGELRLTDAVRFLGERQDAEQVMASLDVLLVPSTEEPFGRTVIEAMAMGVPVIATDVGGPSEILRDGRDGVVLPPDELEAWVRAASSLARRGRRQESREYATERFSSQRHAAAVISVYEQVLARNGTAQRRTGA